MHVTPTPKSEQTPIRISGLGGLAFAEPGIGEEKKKGLCFYSLILLGGALRFLTNECAVGDESSFGVRRGGEGGAQPQGGFHRAASHGERISWENRESPFVGEAGAANRAPESMPSFPIRTCLATLAKSIAIHPGLPCDSGRPYLQFRTSPLYENWR